MADKGTSTVTYQKKLTCKHPEWFADTKKLYNEVLNFYYHLLEDYLDIAFLSSQNALRELEKLTIMGRSGEKPRIPLPFEKLPLYFRRAAINGAIAMMHSYIEKRKNWESEKKGSSPKPAKEIQTSPVFYKGMYKKFEEDSILLKLFTGKSWCWMKCRLKGRAFPKNGVWLSPSAVTGKYGIMLHVPVKTEVTDARTVKERMEAGDRVCGIAFTNGDAAAVCAVYNADGSEAATRFIRGGKEFAHHSKKLLEKIRQNRKVMGRYFDWTGANKKYWKHLRNLKEYYSHKISREILNFCREYGVKVIIEAKTDGKIPAYMERFFSAGSPYVLSGLIKQKLSYKAWQEGMVITTVRPNYTAGKCTVCRSYIKRDGKSGRGYRCENGHKGNRDLNTARNIGKMGLKKFGRLTEKESMQIQFA